MNFSQLILLVIAWVWGVTACTVQKVKKPAPAVSGDLNLSESQIREDLIKAIGLVQPDMALSNNLKILSINAEASWYGSLSVPKFRAKDSGNGTSFDLFICKDKACQPDSRESFRLIMPESALPDLEAGLQRFKARSCRGSVCGQWTASPGYFQQKAITDKELHGLITRRAGLLKSMRGDCDNMDVLLRKWQSEQPGEGNQLPDVMRNNLINLGPDYCYRLAVSGVYSVLESVLEQSDVSSWQSIVELDTDTFPGATLLASGSTHFANTALEKSGQKGKQSSIPDGKKILIQKKDLQVPRLSPEETRKFQEMMARKQSLWRQSSNRVASAAFKTIDRKFIKNPDFKNMSVLDPVAIFAVMGFILLQDDPESLKLTAKSSSPYQEWLLSLSEIRAAMKEKEEKVLKLTQEIESELSKKD